MATEKKEQPTKVVTGTLRFSYAHVFEPQAVDGGDEKKYSVCLLIPKKDVETIAKINAAVEAAKIEGKTKLWNSKIPAKLKLPLRDGDDPDEAKGPEYAGNWFINATSKSKPGVVDKDLNPIIERDEFYSGCFGRAAVNFFAFSQKGSNGVACGLNNVQKLKDGEAFGSKSNPEDDFGGVPYDESDIDEDDDLM